MANILDLPRDQFLASLNELAAQGVNTDDLRRQYRQRNSIFAPIFDWASDSEQSIADQGRTTAGMGLLSKVAGTTGMDALRSVQFEPSNFVAGLLAGGAQAADAPAAAAQGLIPAQDMPMEALNVAGTAQLGGAASMGRGIVDYDPNTVRAFSDYLKEVNPSGARIAASDRPNLMMGDMYGMLPRGSRRISQQDGVTFHRGPDGDYYATAYNPDVGEQDVVGYIMPRGDMTELAVVGEMQGQGIGSQLQYLLRREDPNAPTGGLTEGGEAALRKTYDRLVDEGILSANRDATAGAIGAAASDFGRNWSDRYHWTRSNDFIDEFNPDISTSAMSQLGPHIGTKAAAEARMLAFPNDVGQMLNLRADLNKPFLNPRTNQPWSEVGLESYISEMADYYGVDRRSVAPMIRRDLAAEGYTDIPYINDVEDAGSVSNIMLVDRPQSSDAVLRYQDALFDPLNRTSPNLNAANASPLAGILAMPNEEERNRRLGLLFGGY